MLNKLSRKNLEEVLRLAKSELNRKGGDESEEKGQAFVTAGVDRTGKSWNGDGMRTAGAARDQDGQHGGEFALQKFGPKFCLLNGPGNHNTQMCDRLRRDFEDFLIFRDQIRERERDGQDRNRDLPPKRFPSGRPREFSTLFSSRKLGQR